MNHQGLDWLARGIALSANRRSLLACLGGALLAFPLIKPKGS